MQEIDKFVFKCIIVSALIFLITSIVIADEEELELTRGKADATTPAYQTTEVQSPKAMPYNSVQKYANTLKGDNILSWRIQSMKDDDAIFQAYVSINPAHGCFTYQNGCDYDDYTWISVDLLKKGKPIRTGYSSGTKPGEELQPEKFKPYIQGWERIEVAVYGTAPITSDEVEFSLYGGSNNARGAFFTKRFPYVHTWYPKSAG